MYAPMTYPENAPSVHWNDVEEGHNADGGLLSSGELKGTGAQGSSVRLAVSKEWCIHSRSPKV